LQTLRRLRVLDTDPESQFDAITRLVASLLDTPIALVSLVDADRQWFKSRYGLDAPETPRDISFCGHVVETDAPLIVENAKEDDRFVDNPLVDGAPHIRFYAGYPLRTPDGHTLGTLCAIDSTPRTLAPEKAEVIQLLAGQVVQLLELRRTALELEEQKEATFDFQSFFNLGVELMCTFGDDLRLQLANSAWEQTLGIPLGLLRSRPLDHFIVEAERDEVRSRLLQLFADDEPSEVVVFRTRMQHDDDSFVRLEWSARAARGKVYAVARDITSQSEQEETLRERERTLRAVFEGMREGVVMQAASGAIVANNAAAEEVLGLTGDQLRGRTSVDERWRSVHADGTPYPGEEHASMRSLRSGERITNDIMGVHKPNGALTWLSINSVPLFDDEGSRAEEDGVPTPYAVVSTFRDITDERQQQQLKERLMSQERLVTTGTLAAGVGHEINNPLSYILSNAHLALEEVRDIAGGSPSGRLSELEDMLHDVKEGAVRIQRIVRGLKGLAREDSEMVPTRIEDVLDMSVHMAMHEIRQRATLISDVAELPVVIADSSRLGQVFVNLLVNAAQAFERSDPAHNVIRMQAHEESGFVRIRISDNGPGMPLDVKSRIFDPFFTTKPVGVGTGLGLSITHTIVHAHQGRVEVDTEEGQGTTFHVVLPLAEVPDDDKARPKAVAQRGRVLIVDDDEAVTRTLKRILQKTFSVSALSDPRLAWSDLESGQRYDVVLCDLMMPHLTGSQLFQRVLELDGEQARRFVFLTGGAYDEENAAFLNVVKNEVLDKPYEVERLREVVANWVAEPYSSSQ